ACRPFRRRSGLRRRSLTWNQACGCMMYCRCLRMAPTLWKSVVLKPGLLSARLPYSEPVMPSSPKEPIMNFSVGQVFETVINWLLTHVGWFFDGLSAFVGFVVGFVEWVLVGVHPVVVIGAMALLALVVTRSLGMLVFSIIAFAFVVYANLWVQTMESLAIVLVAVAVALLIGIPLGIWAGLSNTVSAIMRPVLDVMQSMPVFVYLIPAVFFFGVGMVPGIAATIVFSIPPAVRLTELGVRGLDAELVEAATAFGAR